MKKYFNFLELRILFLFLICPTLFGQSLNKSNSEFELALENAGNDVQATLNITGSGNGLILKLINKDFYLSDQSILTISADNNSITCNNPDIRNKVSTYLEPSTITHRKSYSIFINAPLTNEDLLKVINSNQTKISLTSKGVDWNWVVEKNSLDKIKPLFAKATKKEFEKTEEDLSVAELSDADKIKYSVENGVLLKKIEENSPFKNSELKENSAIIQMDGLDIENVDQFYKLLKEKKNTFSIFTVITNSGDMQFLNIKIP